MIKKINSLGDGFAELLIFIFDCAVEHLYDFFAKASDE